MVRPEMGQQITASHGLVRCRGERREWKRRMRQRAPLSGIYVGYRTYADGNVEWYGPEEGNFFKPDFYYEVWLIVPNERTNPVPVLPVDCEAFDGQ